MRNGTNSTTNKNDDLVVMDLDGADEDGDTEELTDYALKKYVVHVPEPLPPATTTTPTTMTETAPAGCYRIALRFDSS